MAAESEEGDETEQENADGEDAGNSSHGASKHSITANGLQQEPTSGGVQLGDMRVDTGFKSAGPGGGPPIGQISPASDFRRGSMSPGVAGEGRYAARLHMGVMRSKSRFAATLSSGLIVESQDSARRSSKDAWDPDPDKGVDFCGSWSKRNLFPLGFAILM